MGRLAGGGRALEAGGLACSGSEAQLLCIAASLAAGVAVDLRRALSGLDERNAALVVAATAHAAGGRRGMVAPAGVVR